MPRDYKKKDTNRLRYSQEDVAGALVDEGQGMSLRQASRTYSIPVMTLQKRVAGKVESPGQSGRHTALIRGEEEAIAENLATISDFGMAFDRTDLKMFIQSYLNRGDRQVAQFKNNMPGDEWVRSFLNRHADILTQRVCQNINRSRAAVSDTIVAEYFGNLETSLEGVPPRNIINYDETNLTDDPEGKQMIFRRGLKHAERIMNSSKTSTSIMFAATAKGDMLSPMVVYKGQRKQPAWELGGPLNCLYECSISGWFDRELFEMWFKPVVIPFVKRLPNDEMKAVIGDNCASHMSPVVIKLAEDNNIRMVFLPPNATHLLQPLDVGIYGPLKSEWRKIITRWRLGEGQCLTTLPKSTLPRLLLQLVNEMDGKWIRLCESAFRTTGVYPFNPEAVLSKLRRDDPDKYPRKDVSPVLLQYLKAARDSSVMHRVARKKKVNVPPGAVVTSADLEQPSTSGAAPEPKRRKLQKKTSEEDEESSVELEEDESTEEQEVMEEEDGEEIDVTPVNLKKSDYVLVCFKHASKLPYHYVGQLSENKGKEWLVQYWRRTDTLNKKGYVSFKTPENKDESWVNEDQILYKLRVAEVYKNTIRFKNVFADLCVR